MCNCYTHDHYTPHEFTARRCKWVDYKCNIPIQIGHELCMYVFATSVVQTTDSSNSLEHIRLERKKVPFILLGKIVIDLISFEPKFDAFSLESYAFMYINTL